MPSVIELGKSRDSLLSTMEFFRLNLVCPLLLFFALLITSTASTQISFPQFSANYSAAWRPYGDVQYNEDHQSFILNAQSAATSKPTCSQLLYEVSNIPFKEFSSSFSTSFTFKVTTPPQQPIWDDFNYTRTSISSIGSKLSFGMANSLYYSDDSWEKYWANQNSSCKQILEVTGILGFSFQTTYNYHKGEPSNNFIALGDENNIPILQPGSIYNLCGNQTHCSYLTNGSTFTTWIDYTPNQTFEVYLLEGSHNEKPRTPLLVIYNYKISLDLGEYISICFLGSSAKNSIVSHELLAWNFNTNSEQKDTKKSSTKWIAPTFGIGGIILIILMNFTLYKLLLRKSSNHKAIIFPSKMQVFLYKEMCKATRNFSEDEKIGSGAHGTIYKGSFGDTLVAVKHIKHESKYAKTSFHAEISSLALIQHRNIVQLLGWCHEKNRLLLVYNYMSNGSLNEWLHKGGRNNNEHNPLVSWKLRKCILQDVATTIEYLHSDCVECILHRDIKSSNVMLDKDFKAHVGDFGLTRLMDHNKHEQTTMAAGTLGYMAPELPHTGKATKESDVYSFGILVLEVVCGRQPLDLKAQEPEDIVLLHCVWRAQEAGMLLSMVDPKLLQDHMPSSRVEICHNDKSIYEMPNSLDTSKHPYDLNDCNMRDPLSIDDGVEVERVVKNLLHLGLMCCLPNPKARPTMEQVMQILQEIDNIDSIDYVITSLPPLQETKPSGLYSLVEFLHTPGFLDPIEV